MLMLCWMVSSAGFSSARAQARDAAVSSARPAAVHNGPARAARQGNASSSGSNAGQDNSLFGAFNNRNRGPVNIQSDSMTMDYKNDTVLFSGDVHAKQADGQLMSNTLNVKYGKDFHEVQQMIADGNVRISQGLRWCTSDHGVMNQADHTVVLTGDPVCHDENDQISGTKITVHMDTGKSEVEGGVKAVIFPRDSKNRDNKAAPTQ
jgi:lipopolysaccharide export system protein LptA